MKRIHLRLLVATVFVLVFPFFLNRRPRVVRRALLPGTPEEIFPLVNDLRNWPRWTEWSRRENLHFSYDGDPAGVGAVQRWEGRRMSGAMRITQSVPSERVVYDVELEGGKYQLEGTFALEPVRGHTRATWLCKWRPSRNPFARYRDLAVMWFIGRDFERGLENLRALAAEQRAPVAAA